MAEYWIYYAIAASLCIGLYWFAQKIKSEIPGQSDNGFIFYSYFLMWISGLAWPIFFEKQLDIFNLDTLLYAFAITFFYIVIVKTRLKSLKYLSSSTYFINYRIASSFWLLIVWVIIFSESISFKELIWICIWFIVFYLLIEKKTGQESINDVKKWFLFLLIGSFAVTGVQAVAKNFALSNLDIFTLVLWQWIFWVMFVLLLKWKEPVFRILEIKNKSHFWFLFISWTIFWTATILNNYALIWWDLAVVYKIISYSLFIPIVLSIIIYKEHVSRKKILAFILTLISIFLFI